MNFLQNNPEICRKFVSASIKGWLYCFENEEEALDIVMSYALGSYNKTNRAHQRWMLNRMKDLIIPSKDTIIGKLDIDDHENVMKILQDSGMITQRVPYDEMYIDLISDRNTTPR